MPLARKPLNNGDTKGRRSPAWATWATPTLCWARRARPSSTTSRRWPSPARSGQKERRSQPGQPGQRLRRSGRDAKGHRILRACPGHRSRDRRPKGRREPAGQPGQCLRRPGRDAQGHRVPRAGLWPSHARSATEGAKEPPGQPGLAYAELGETRKAIEYHEQALAIAREIGDKQNEGEFLCNLGKAYLDLNEIDKSHRSLHAIAGHRSQDRISEN